MTPNHAQVFGAALRQNRGHKRSSSAAAIAIDAQAVGVYKPTPCKTRGEISYSHVRCSAYCIHYSATWVRTWPKPPNPPCDPYCGYDAVGDCREYPCQAVHTFTLQENRGCATSGSVRMRERPCTYVAGHSVRAGVIWA